MARRSASRSIGPGGPTERDACPAPAGGTGVLPRPTDSPTRTPSGPGGRFVDVSGRRSEGEDRGDIGRTASDPLVEALTGELAGPDGLLATTGTPGVALVVVDGGQTVVARGWGRAPGGPPLDIDTVLQVGSVSKPVAAITAFLAADAGSVDLDDPIDDVLRPVVEIDAAAGPVTPRDLLTHSAGASVSGFLGYGADEPVPDLAGVLRGEGNSEPVALTADRSFRYSGGGYAALEHVLVEATGEALADLALRLLVRPLGLDRTGFSIEPPGWPGGATISPGSVDGQPLDGGWRRHPETAAAGLWSTAGDLARLVAELTAGRLSSVLPRMLEHSSSAPADDGIDRHVGTGWFLDRPDDPQWFWHNGRNLGFSAEVVASVDGARVVVACTNALEGPAVIAGILDLVARDRGWGDGPRW